MQALTYRANITKYTQAILTFLTGYLIYSVQDNHIKHLIVGLNFDYNSWTV